VLDHRQKTFKLLAFLRHIHREVSAERDVHLNRQPRHTQAEYTNLRSTIPSIDHFKETRRAAAMRALPLVTIDY
jgi:hypothetical protein